MAESDGDEIDAAAILERRKIFRRRVVLLGVAVFGTSAGGCRPCLAPPLPEPVCSGRFIKLPPAMQHWRQDGELGEVFPLRKTLFHGDTLNNAPHGPVLTLSGEPHLVNTLSPDGVAAFEELAPFAAMGELSIYVYVYPAEPDPPIEGPAYPGAGADGKARAASVRGFLSNRGVRAKTDGDGECPQGNFHVSVSVTLCAKGR